VTTNAELGRLQGKVALVTGATQAMGEAIALRLCRSGAIVVGVGRSHELGESVAERLCEQGHTATFVRADVSLEADVAAAVQSASERFGRLDIVVNNAAAFDARESAAHLESTETFDAILKVGLYAPFWFAKYAAPVMIGARNGGLFVNISSYAGSRGIKGMPAYSASKGGLEALTRQIAAEYALDGIRANALVLGSIAVPRNMALHDDEGISAAYRRARMTERVGEPNDVAAMVEFLASDDGGFITGASIDIDGGLLAKAPVVTTMNQMKASEAPRS
jgi:NAD(P)-dependent dehydrogenase (short-subunit alcohol dehydrogenase family)